MAYGALMSYGNTAVSNVTLPNKIKCIRCKVIKGPAAFATNRQDILKAKLKQEPQFNAIAKTLIPCLQCTAAGGNVVELHCAYCDKTKGKDDFSKVQRRNPDKARCLKCAAKRQQEEDGESSSDDSGCTNESSDNEYSYGSDEGTHTTTVGVSNLSLTEGEGGSPRVKLASNSGYDGYTSGGITISNGAGSDTESVTTNRTTAVHSQLRQKAPYYAAASVPNKTSKWAKPPAAPPRKTNAHKDSDDDDVYAAPSDTDSD